MPDHVIRSPQVSDAVWERSDFPDSSTWTVVLTRAERSEIVEAARSDAADDSHLFPTLRSRCGRWAHTLNSGCGFVLLRGFPLDELGTDEIERAYLALGAMLGDPVSQDRDGSVLTHIRDERIERTDPTVRLYRTRERQDFHTDGSDLVALLCLAKAATGGESWIASSAAIYNEVLRRRPDLLEVLYSPMPWDRNGEEAAGDPPYFELAPLNDIGGVPRLFYISWYIRDSQRHPQAPRLTAEQHEALELVEAIANEPRFHVEMVFEPGDVQILNNGRILHARNTYQDHPDLDKRRHLLRLWLSAASAPSVAEPLRSGIPRR
ncbi:taurine catabolism dioxygenase TauD, TfdA family protein [Rhodococcus sp. MTM3W5.2]|uniref:TauD/TfdA family dioxygenase n=1 Tax=Rhodococcus sp. MTM3W5.2 TaxID=1805827 RepID=UPI0009796F9D|nr:TauD/TfdA family dioxygenase [Rhodococcus sp. MTM3W5.2]AQA23778.1 taurine catabolism dioxygenase TauD, TfdA family protein [Rhodococcus sp. MTM3W5.2]